MPIHRRPSRNRIQQGKSLSSFLDWLAGKGWPTGVTSSPLPAAQNQPAPEPRTLYLYEETHGLVITTTDYGEGIYGENVYPPAGLLSNQLALGPQVPGVKWYPSIIVCQSSSSTPTVFTAYLNFISPTTALTSTEKGNQDTLYLYQYVQLAMGQKIIGVWTNLDPTANIDMTIIGTKQVPGIFRG
jgi:hypothetical protein